MISLGLHRSNIFGAINSLPVISIAVVGCSFSVKGSCPGR